MEALFSKMSPLASNFLDLKSTPNFGCWTWKSRFAVCHRPTWIYRILRSMSLGYLSPIGVDRRFCPPPPVQERVKYLLCSTFGNRHVSCLDTISKMGFTICSFILLNPVEAYSCLQVRFINFVKVLTILINA